MIVIIYYLFQYYSTCFYLNINININNKYFYKSNEVDDFSISDGFLTALLIYFYSLYFFFYGICSFYIWSSLVLSMLYTLTISDLTSLWGFCHILVDHLGIFA